MNGNRDLQKGILYVTGAAIGYGIIPLLTIIAIEEGANEYSMSFCRFLASTVILVVIMPFVKNMNLRINKRQGIQLAGLSLLYAITPILLTLAYVKIDTGLATVIHYGYPVFVIIIARLFFKEKITAKKLICAIVCFLGVAMLSSPSGDINFIGAILALISGLTYGSYVVFMEKSVVADMSLLSATFWISLFSFIAQGIMAFSVGKLPITHFGLDLSVIGWLAILLTAIFSTIIPIILFQKGTLLIGSVKASLIAAVEPITSVVVGVIVLNEHITILTAMGMLAILIAVTIINLPSRQR